MADDRHLRDAIAGMVKLALNLRLAALLLTMVWLPVAQPPRQALVVGLLVAAAATSLVALLAWDRIDAWVLAHPAAVLVDLLVAMAILGAVGLDTPFGLFVLSTALVTGVLYGWVGAAVMSTALLLAYVGGAAVAEQAPTLAEVLGTPALVPALAAGGAAVRGLLLRHHGATVALAEATERTAAETERTRLAREMHDTLIKTLHGIALNATAVSRLAVADPDRAASTAGDLASTAGRAADQARSLVADLRADELERPLGDALEGAMRAWPRRTGVEVVLDLDEGCQPSPSARYELFCIAREALRNAHEHGGAGTVEVRLRDGEQVALTVRDDGCGFRVPDDLADLAADQHYGVVGMAERAAAVGGRLELDSHADEGTVVTAVVPRAGGRAPGSSSAPGPGASEGRT